MRTAPPPPPHRPYAGHRRPARPVGSPGLRLLRGVSGALAVGLIVLTGVLAVAQWLSESAPVPGPGVATIAGHGAGAVLAVLVQVIADRSRGRWSAVAASAVLVIVAVVLWFGWWR